MYQLGIQQTSHVYKIKRDSNPKPIGDGLSNSQVYIHTQALQFYQCEMTPTFIFFVFLSIWDNTHFHTPNTPPHV